MDFSSIDGNLPHDLVQKATQKFNQIVVELGLRDTNYYVGSGLGGNNFQLYTILTIPQTLSYTKKEIVVDETGIKWGAEWLANATALDIRKKVDTIFAQIAERHKYHAAVAELLSDNPSALRRSIELRKDQFPILFKILEGKNYRFDRSLSLYEQLLLAMIMCNDLASKLDAGDTSMIPTIGSALLDFDPEIILIAIRKCIGLERLITFNLDEDPIFSRSIYKVLDNVK